MRWAIETGVIERLYTIGRGITESLIDMGLDAIEQYRTQGAITRQVAKLIEDQRASLDFVFAYIKEERPLSISYIKELHQLLLRNQETTEAVTPTGQRITTALLRGTWKRLPNNPLTPDGSIHEYCPADFVQDEMESLLSMHQRHEETGVRPEVEAAWIHHRFTQMHPFKDGNGRIARALATMIFLKAGFLPLVIRDEEHREAYLDALARADQGDLSPLVNLFANIQSTDLSEAITYVRELRGEGITSLARAAAGTVKRRIAEDEGKLLELTEALVSIARDRFEEVRYELEQAFQETGIRIEAYVIRNDDNNDWYWQHQIISAAKTYQYFADLSRQRRWIQLRLTVPSANVPRWHIVISFHHKETRAALMAVVAFLTSVDTGLEEQRVLLLGTPNEFTFSSSREPEDEFRRWLERAVTHLPQEWQARL